MSERVNTPSGLDAEKRSDQKPASNRLESWKEIAAYLKRDLRTVQRWEKKEGLPVHRHRHDERASVFAFKSELDAWWQNEYLQLGIEDRQSPSPHAAIEQVPIARTTGANWFGRNRSRLAVAAATAVVIAAAATLILVRFRGRTPALTERDTIVLADFSNSTGDPVFDDALREALAADLEQSPFLNILSSGQVQRTLRLMNQAPGSKLGPALAQEICQRTGSKAYLVGSIAAIGTTYAVSLEALNCQSGETFTREEAQASGKEQVLNALDESARKLRRKLGESLASIQKYDVPLDHVTTSSLDALKAYSLGGRAHDEHGTTASIPYERHAVEIDPNFASAYAALGRDYAALGEDRLGDAYLTRAYELRQRTSERESLNIASLYNIWVAGDLEQANQVLDLWRHVYPRDLGVYQRLGLNSFLMGRYEQAASYFRDALTDADPGFRALYLEDLADCFLALNRFAEAKAAALASLSYGDGADAHTVLYALALLNSDAANLAKERAWGEGEAGHEDLMLSLASETETLSGRLGRARDLSRQASEADDKFHFPGRAALLEAAAALREAFVGNNGRASKIALASLAVSPGRETKALVALTMAVSGDEAEASKLAEQLEREHPSDILLKRYWIPAMRAVVATNEGKPATAIELLKPAEQYELGFASAIVDYTCLYPVYVRGEAFLAERQPSAASAEFQKYVDHRGLVWNCPLTPLAHLGLARAHAMEAKTAPDGEKQADFAKARAAYQEFLTLWKDADPDIPILKQAKGEYAKLK